MRYLIQLFLLFVVSALFAECAFAQTTTHQDTKTFTAQATFNKGFVFSTSNYESVAGAGTTVANAAALSAVAHVHRITGADGTVGWKFVTALPIGAMETLLNTTAGVPKIYGESGSTVNGGSVDAAWSPATGVQVIICFKTALLTYICA